MVDFPNSVTADATRVTADSTLITADASSASPSAAFYLSLVTAYHRGRPRFAATVTASVAPFADAGAVASTLSDAFDLDAAVGAQLDVDGQWIGASRVVPVPLPNVYFSLDSDTLGLDQGVIQGPYDDDIGLSTLPDETYRRLLRTKAQANHWDGQPDTLAAILRAFLPNPGSLISVADQSLAVTAPLYFSLDDDLRGFDQADLYRPTFLFDTDGHGVDEGYILGPTEFGDIPDSLAGPLSVVIANKIPTNLDLAVLAAGLLPFKPMGQRLEILVATEDRTPVFGLDMDTALIGGFDVGSIGADPGTVAALRT